jgi:hypothetical protein
VTHLRDGSVFFGLLPRAQPEVDIQNMVMRTAEDEVKKVKASATQASAAIAESDGVAETSAAVRNVKSEADDDDVGASGGVLGALERARSPEAAALDVSDAAFDTPAAFAGPVSAAVGLKGGDDGGDSSGSGAGAQNPIAAAAVCATDVAADSSDANAALQPGALELQQDSLPNSAVGDCDVANAELLSASDAPSGAEVAPATSPSSAAAAAAAPHPPVRQLRQARVPASSSPMASGVKSSRHNSDSLSSSCKAAAPQAEQDSVFIRSAVAPAIECFSPVFHFQRCESPLSPLYWCRVASTWQHLQQNVAFAFKRSCVAQVGCKASGRRRKGGANRPEVNLCAPCALCCSTAYKLS